MSETRIYITEAEGAELIVRTAGSGHAVPVAFGGGAAWIEPGAPDSLWALRELADIRGIDLTKES